jgi:hypothetical protein
MIRETEEGISIFERVALRNKSQGLLSTLEESKKEISLMKARIAANDKYFDDLLSTLVDYTK